MPRRKRGRDKQRGKTKRSRKQELPKLNAVAAWRVGEPRPTSGRDYIMVEEPRRPWKSPRRPFPSGLELGETIGFYSVDGKVYLGRPRGVST